jgi:hypothetical protein
MFYDDKESVKKHNKNINGNIRICSLYVSLVVLYKITSSLRRVTSQKGKDLIYMAAGAWVMLILCIFAG